MARSESEARFQVGEWVVDPAADEILRDGAVTKLEPRMMRLLVRLAEAAGQVVSSQRLLEEVWPDVVVGPASVYQSVSQLRKTLGDTDSPPRYIGTVPRKGYRLVAPVHPLSPLPAAISVPIAPTTYAIPRRVWLLTAALVLIAALGGGLYLLKFAHPLTPQSPSIAVLPFVDMTSEQGDQPFCDGLSEELSNWLAQVPSLRVVARTSAFAFRGRSQDVRVIGRELSATHLLEGSVRRAGSQVRVTAQLVDARSGYHVWSTSIDRPFTDVVQIQEDIARSVADALQVRLTPAAVNRLSARRAADARAYEVYLRARQQERERTAASNHRAMELYFSAIATDSRFALAYAGLASAMLNERYLSGRSISDISRQVEPLIEKALSLNATLPEAYRVRGTLRTDQLRLDEAAADLNRAVRLNPSDAASFASLGRVYRARAETRDALASFERAAKLDPLDFMVHAEKCLELQDLGRYDEALSACARARALDLHGTRALTITAWLALAQGKIDAAIGWTDRALQVNPRDAALLEMRAHYLLLLNLPAAAREAYELLRRASNDADEIDLEWANIIFVDKGADGLRAHLASARLERSTHARTLLAAAQLHMLIGNFALAKQLTDRALSAKDFDRRMFADPGSVRWGSSDVITVVTAELRAGDETAAGRHLSELKALLERIARNGGVGYGLHVVVAETQALNGEADAAMHSLQKAVDLGWRGAVWAPHEPQFAVLWPRSDFQALIHRVARMNDLMRAKVHSGLDAVTPSDGA